MQALHAGMHVHVRGRACARTRTGVTGGMHARARAAYTCPRLPTGWKRVKGCTKAGKGLGYVPKLQKEWTLSGASGDVAQKEGKAVAAPVEDWKWWTGETAASSYFSHVLPMRGSVIDLLLSASNRETGTGFTDRCLPPASRFLPSRNCLVVTALK